MAKKDLLELKRRFKKNECTITRVCGCYVNAEKEKVTRIDETFLNLQDDEFYKYLEIAKKTLSGTFGNNILELDVPIVEEKSGGKQQFLMGLRDSRLRNGNLLERFYDLIIDTYEYVGNYLILVYHDVYDVITKTNDNRKLDESEEVYEYLLCSVCPVSLSKPGLGYRDDENRIGARIRDWVVGAPEIGFVFPAFVDRSSDIHIITYYVKDTKNSHAEFIEGVLGCNAKHTVTEQRKIFADMIKDTVMAETGDKDELLINIHKNLNEAVEENEEQVALTKEVVVKAMKESNLSDGAIKDLEKKFDEEFKFDSPAVQDIVDSDIIKEDEKERETKELRQEVTKLQEQLVVESEKVKTYDVILRTKPEKENKIKVEIIAGQKYVMVPVGESDHVNVNGVAKTL